MGICKCKKRTDFFCFVHKKAVCEKCMIEEHQTCVVKTYVDWLTDSEYEPAKCGCCKQELEGNIIRLSCLDIHHVSCLNQHASALPAHTARAGYRCPACGKELFPRDPSSPLALQFYSQFKENWATQWKEDSSDKGESPKASAIVEKFSASAPYPSLPDPKTPEKAPSASLPTTPIVSSSTNSAAWKSPQIPVPTPLPTPDPSSLGIAARKTQTTTTKPLESVSYREDFDKRFSQDDDEGDIDNDKYQKKSFTQLLVALGFMSRKSVLPLARGDKKYRLKLNTTRIFILLVLIICIFVVLMMGVSLSNNLEEALNDEPGAAVVDA